jgi:GT2 family glycosyltransferase
MPDLDLSVNICSWNTLEDLRICLASLEGVRKEARFEVIVVDNNSEEGSPDMVAAEFPWVRLERMEKNLGFTGGNNHALAVQAGRHSLLLNSDTVVHPGAIAAALSYLEAHPEVGILGPKVLNPNGSLQYSCRRFPNPVAALFRNTAIGKLWPNNPFTRDYLMQDWDHSKEREVDWVSGCALLARQEFVEKAGGLDPEYFMFCEDVDWCWKAWELGFKVMYVPTGTITHKIGTSTDKAPNRMIGRFHRSMFRFYTKNMVPKQFVLWRPFLVAFAASALAIRASVFIVKNKLDDMKRKRQR